MSAEEGYKKEAVVVARVWAEEDMGSAYATVGEYVPVEAAEACDPEEGNRRVGLVSHSMN